MPEIGKRVRPVDLRATNAPSDTLVPSYDALSGLFKWIAGGGGPPAVHDKTYHTSPTLPDNDAHKTTSPIDHPDTSVTNAKIASGLDAGKITTGTLADARLQYPVNTHKTASPIDHPDASIRPAKLDAIDSPADGEAATYDSATGKFKWAPAAAAALTLLQAMGTTDVGTTSSYPTYEDMPDMVVEFTLTEQKTVLIIFSLTCYMHAVSSSSMFSFFKLLIDGNCLTGEGGAFGGISNVVNEGDMELVFPVNITLVKTLGAGAHTIKIQWCKLGGDDVWNLPASYPDHYHRRLIVQYL